MFLSNRTLASIALNTHELQVISSQHVPAGVRTPVVEGVLIPEQGIVCSALEANAIGTMPKVGFKNLMENFRVGLSKPKMLLGNSE
jgi:hypothetical protein